jgi:GNAT superfamily N-acetyltransferase
MSEVLVEPVSTRRQRKQFFELPWKIYRDDPMWIPPLRGELKELLGFKKRHPFHDFATMQHFLATRDGEPVGRITAIDNPKHFQRHREDLGFFGFFESIDDEEVAHGLFDAARQWLKDRGLDWIRGPISPSLNYELGLLIDGWHSPPAFMMTYNPRYYERLVESYGFSKCEDLVAFAAHTDIIAKLDKKIDVVIDYATRQYDIKLRKLNTRRFKQDVAAFLEIYNQSLVGTWGFTPLSEGEMAHLVKGMKELIVPELTSFAEIDGEPVAGVFAMLDYNPRIKQIDGRLFPFGFLKLLRNKRAIKKVRILSTNVLPKFQRWGLGLVVLSRLKNELLDWGIGDIELSWVLESNHLSFNTLKRGGAKVDKTYRIYDYGAPGKADSPEQ